MIKIFRKIYLVIKYQFFWKGPKSVFVYGMDVRLCCGDAPIVTEFVDIPVFIPKVTISCASCGDHIHSELSMHGALSIWNRKYKEREYVIFQRSR